MQHPSQTVIFLLSSCSWRFLVLKSIPSCSFSHLFAPALLFRFFAPLSSYFHLKWSSFQLLFAQLWLAAVIPHHIIYSQLSHFPRWWRWWWGWCPCSLSAGCPTTPTSSSPTSTQPSTTATTYRSVSTQHQSISKGRRIFCNFTAKSYKHKQYFGCTCVCKCQFFASPP